MAEKIYMIPVNEAFEASQADPACGCPYCALEKKLENNELDAIQELYNEQCELEVRITKRKTT